MANARGRSSPYRSEVAISRSAQSLSEVRAPARVLRRPVQFAFGVLVGNPAGLRHHVRWAFAGQQTDEPGRNAARRFGAQRAGKGRPPISPPGGAVIWHRGDAGPAALDG